MSSVLRHNTQQTFFLHSRHSQNTQFHFRCSGLKIVSSHSRTQKHEFSFPHLKTWVQFSDTILNSHLFSLTPQSMYAIPFQIFWSYNYEFRFSNLKKLVHFSGLKNKSSIFRHKSQQTSFLHSRHSQYTQFHFRCSGLKIVSPHSRTQKYELSFPELKTWVQFSDTILNSHLFSLTPQSMYAIPFQIFWS